jgi:hypothetical protein
MRKRLLCKKGISLISILGILFGLSLMVLVIYKNSFFTSITISNIINIDMKENSAKRSISNSQEYIKNNLKEYLSSEINENVLYSIFNETTELFNVYIKPTIQYNNNSYENVYLNISKKYNHNSKDYVVSKPMIINFSNNNILVLDTINSKLLDYLNANLGSDYRSGILIYSLWTELILNNSNNFSNFIIQDNNFITNFGNPNNNFTNSNLWNNNINNINGQRYILKEMLNIFSNSIENSFNNSGCITIQGDQLINSINSNLIIFRKNTRINNGLTWYNNNGTIKVIDNSIVFIKGDLITNADLYVEKGSTLFITGNTIFKDNNKTSMYQMNTVDTSYEDSYSCNNNLGGGLMCLGEFVYTLSNNPNMSYGNGIYGNITVGKSIKIDGNSGGSSSYSKIPLSATIYVAMEDSNNPVEPNSQICVSLVNVKYNFKRPNFIFTQGKVEMNYCESEIDNYDNWGLAFIFCKEFDFKRNYSIDGQFKINIFTWMKNNKFDKLEELIINWDEDLKYINYPTNYFITQNDMLRFTIYDINNWFIPEELKGSLISNYVSIIY